MKKPGPAAPRLASCQSHAAVLQKRLDVLWVTGGRGQSAGVQCVRGRGAAGLVGGAGLGIGQSAALGDEDGDEEGE